jgi:hypothetical protein
VLSGESKPWNERRSPDDMHTTRGPRARRPAGGGRIGRDRDATALTGVDRAATPRGVEWRVRRGRGASDDGNSMATRARSGGARGLASTVYSTLHFSVRRNP